ncbi:MAG: sulfur carrier protein ThiS adenylyltransferase ThiF [Chitinivibrionales bacterium]|nr:sulfur carrier protein ThiS adenylyltransferase ThiF [Chitinivibrionales bacterium]
MNSPNNFSFDNVSERYFTPEQIKKTRNTRIGIAGAGGLGSNCAMNLVRCGFEKFVIVDFDNVEESNLNRQFYFLNQIGLPKVQALKESLLRINPAVSIKTYQLKLDKQNIGNIFASCTVIVEAFDTAGCKAMLAETFINSDKFVVCASGLAGFGDSDRIKVKKIRDNFFMIGDQTSEISAELKPLSPAVSIAAAKQADVILAWVLGR